MPRLTRRKIVLLAVLAPLALALHACLIWLGGGWRIFALVEAGIGIFLAGALRDVKKLEQSSAGERDPKK